MSISSKVFIAGPFTVAMNNDKIFDNLIRSRIENIHTIIQSLDKEIFSSHRRENWGENLDRPESLAQIDMVELKQCGHMVVYWGTKVSVGVSIEIGLAIANKIPILLIREYEPIGSDFYLGLVKLGFIKEIIWKDNIQIEKSINSFLKR